MLVPFIDKGQEAPCFGHGSPSGYHCGYVTILLKRSTKRNLHPPLRLIGEFDCRQSGLASHIDAIRAFDTPLGRLGVLICEDFWHASPPYLLWLDGADLLLFISASPGRGLDTEESLESARWVEHVAQAYASLFTTFVTNVARVGFEDGLGFWGGSVVFDPHGELVARGPYHEESLFVANLDLHQLHRARTRLPLLRDERTDLVQRELKRIRHSSRSGSHGPREHLE